MPLPSNGSGENDIQVIFVGTEPVTPSGEQALRELLDTSEIERLHRFRYDTNRRQYLYSHALLRLGLSSMCNVVPSAWRFAQDRLGRPRIAFPTEYRHIAFSLSHTTSLVACAFAASGEIGFDAEGVDRIDMEETSKLIFSDQERQAWQRLESPAQRTSRFYRLWTMKEALLKALGMGLYLAPSSISIDLETGGRPVIRMLPVEFGEPLTWTVVDIDASSGHFAALAAKTEPRRFPKHRYVMVEPQALLAMLREQETTPFPDRVSRLATHMPSNHQGYWHHGLE